MKKWLVPVVIVGLAFISAMWLVGVYNGIITKDENVSKEWAQVQTVYQRRADLIPNLVATVKGYAEYEGETLTAVVEARAKATGININADNLTQENLQQFQQAQAGLSSALSKLLVVVEKYPDLKANQNFLELQAQLEGTENRITVQRQKYNDAVNDLNGTIRRFPGSVVKGFAGVDARPYFEADAGSEAAPKVDF